MPLGPSGLPPSETVYAFRTSSPFISRSFRSLFSTTTLSASVDADEGGPLAEKACNEESDTVSERASLLIFPGLILLPPPFSVNSSNWSFYKSVFDRPIPLSWIHRQLPPLS